MNGFNLSNISDLYVGSAQASALYKGSSLIWQSAPDYSTQYLTIESLEDDNEIAYRLYKSGSVSTLNIPISYSTDGITWNTKDYAATNGNVMATLNTGDKLYLKGTNNYYSNAMTWGSTIVSSATYNIYGNIMSLLNGDNFINTSLLDGTTNKYAFCNLFRNSKVVDASNLILPENTAEYCYGGMFYQCTSLTSAPSLPATTLSVQCYRVMFNRCSSLTTAPVLPATTLISNCYYQMFYLCSSLNYIKAMFTTTPGQSYTAQWVYGVAASGTFVKNSAAEWTTTGANGVPTGWTVQTASA